MKLLHTSDLHLGRQLHGISLSEAQQAFLKRIVEIAVANGVEVVIVAGDVYDRAYPPADAVVMFEQFLVDCDRAGIAVVVISGNHDQAERLGYGASLFRDRLHVFTRPEFVHVPATFADEHGEVLIYGIPYLEPEVARRALTPEGEPILDATHEAVVGAAMQRVRHDLAGRAGNPRVIVTAHAFVVGGEASDSERDLAVGGAPSVGSAVFADVHYVALGHLHGPQQPASIGTDAVLRYSGSPLRYSVSERDHVKSVSLVTLDAAGGVDVTLVPIEQPRPMADLRGTIDDLLSDAHLDHVDSWVRLTCTDDVRPESMIPRLRARFPHAIEFRHQGAVAANDVEVAHVDKRSNPFDVAVQFIEDVRGSAPTAEELRLLREVVEAAQKAAAQ